MRSNRFGLASLTVHTGIVNLFNFLGDRADRRVTVSAALVFSPEAPPLDQATLGEVDRALGWFERVDRIDDGGIGLFSHPGALVRKAWLYACKKDFTEAERLLRLHEEREGVSDLICRDIGKLMRARHEDQEALTYYRSVLDAHPTFGPNGQDLFFVGELVHLR